MAERAPRGIGSPRAVSDASLSWVDWPLLAPLSREERDQFLSLARVRSFGRNEVLCHAGDPADSLHLVDQGHLAVRVGLSNGSTATLNVLSAGDYFGELALLSGHHRRTATILALEPSRTLVVSSAAFDSLCARVPGVERVVSTLLAARVEALSQRLVETMYESLDRRVYRCLLELARSYGSQDGVSTIPLSQAHLADLVGAARPSVNQVLQRMVAQGLVHLGRGRVDVLDVAALARRCPP